MIEPLEDLVDALHRLRFMMKDYSEDTWYIDELGEIINKLNKHIGR